MNHSDGINYKAFIDIPFMLDENPTQPDEGEEANTKEEKEIPKNISMEKYEELGWKHKNRLDMIYLYKPGRTVSTYLEGRIVRFCSKHGINNINIGLFGFIGSGKSTLINRLAWFLDKRPWMEDLLPIRQIDISEYRKKSLTTERTKNGPYIVQLLYLGLFVFNINSRLDDQRQPDVLQELIDAIYFSTSVFPVIALTFKIELNPLIKSKFTRNDAPLIEVLQNDLINKKVAQFQQLHCGRVCLIPLGYTNAERENNDVIENAALIDFLFNCCCVADLQLKKTMIFKDTSICC
ncbi:hypothetical protein HZS_5156 [Henneguya salminicola]|nr:hypothetical protein HZS_5156 [Henneguya salminicola]